MKRLLFTLFVIHCSLFTLSGCGSGKVSLQGTVKFADGTPLTVGTVFLSNDLMMYQGKIQPDGTFSIGEMKDGDGIPVGTYKGWIAGTNTVEYVYGAGEGVMQRTIIGEIKHNVIKPKFTEKEQSGLTFTVEKGKKNQIEITVEKP